MTLFELDAVLTLDATQFDTGIANAERDSKTFAQKIGADADSIKKAFSDAFSVSVGQLMAEGFAKALGVTKEFIKESIEVASAVEQTNEKIKVLFGDKGAETIEYWAEGMQKNFGVSAKSAKEYAAEVAGIFGGDVIGLSEDQLLDMSTKLVELSGDLASFHNMSVNEVWNKLLSGMRGETEAIERLGIDVHVATLAGFYNMEERAWSKLEQGQKTMLLYNYILESTKHVEGDFKRTSDTYNNQVALLQANLEDLKDLIGVQLLPIANSLVTFLNTLFEDHRSGAEVVEDLGDEFTKTYVEIGATTQNALALIDALERMQNDGVDTTEEFNKYKNILVELETLIPSISGLIDEQTGSINGGTQALRNHALAWEQDALAAARQKIMQEYYDELARQEMETEKAKVEYQLEDIKANANTDMRIDLLKEAQAYLMLKYPDKYPTIESTQKDFLGQVTGKYGLIHQLWKLEDDDPQVKAYYDALQALEELDKESEWYEKKTKYEESKQRLKEMKENFVILEEVFMNMGLIQSLSPSLRNGTSNGSGVAVNIPKGEYTFPANADAKKVDYYNQTAQLMVEEINRLIDEGKPLQSKYLTNYVNAMNELGGSGVNAVYDFILASGGAAGGWTKGSKNIVLPEDFFYLGKDGQVMVRDWQAALEAFKEAKGAEYKPEDFFGVDLFTSMPDKVKEGARQGTAEAMAGVTISVDGQTLGNVVTPYVTANMARSSRGKKFTNGTIG